MLSVNEINLLQAQNEGLKKQNSELQKENSILKEENYNKLIAWEELQADNEQLKKTIERMKEPELKVIDANIALENAELKADNERLKAEIQEINQAWEDIAEARIEICNQCGERTDYNIPCKQIRNLDYGLQLEIAENEKLKETLQDIKEIAEQRNYLNYGEALDDIINLIIKAESEEE